MDYAELKKAADARRARNASTNPSISNPNPKQPSKLGKLFAAALAVGKEITKDVAVVVVEHVDPMVEKLDKGVVDLTQRLETKAAELKAARTNG